MSYGTEAAAERAGRAFLAHVEKTTGVEGWTLRVHENLGWHMCLHLDGASSCISLHKDKHGNHPMCYSVLIGDKPGDVAGMPEHFHRGKVEGLDDTDALAVLDDAIERGLKSIKESVALHNSVLESLGRTKIGLVVKK